MQNSTKYISAYSVSFSIIPPDRYYYNNGTYHGWLSQETWYGTSSTTWVGVYAGTVYLGAVPGPTKIEK